MSKVLVDEQNLSDIADSIRAKNGTQDTYKPSEMSGAIDDIPSGGGSGDLDWTALGYSKRPQFIDSFYDYAIQIKNNWDSSITSLNNKYMSDKNIWVFPLVDTSNVTDMSSAFAYSNLHSIPLIDTHNVTVFNMTFRGCFFEEIPLFDVSSAYYFTSMFVNCINLVEIPKFTFSLYNNLNLDNMFSGCTSLKNVPLLNVQRCNNFKNMFYNCPSLTDASLDNIIQMCAGTANYTGTKTLKQLGITDTTIYPVSRIEALPHYQDFIDAGWTIGY